MALREDYEWTNVIDSARTLQLNATDDGLFVLTVEDPQSIAIVQMERDDIAALHKELGRLLEEGQ